MRGRIWFAIGFVLCFGNFFGTQRLAWLVDSRLLHAVVMGVILAGAALMIYGMIQMRLEEVRKKHRGR